MNRQERAKELDLTIATSMQELEAELADGYTQDYLALLDFYAKFHRYSALNALLIMMQRPDATRCAGLHKWNEVGYKVRAGEKALWIRAPWLRKEPDPDTGEIVERLVGYLAVPVFDVSQLAGSPQLPSLTSALAGDFEALYSQAKADVLCAGYVLTEESLPTGVHGLAFCDRIVIATGLSTSEKLATLYHELAHAVSDHQQRPDARSTTQKELEAESAAYVIARVHGFALPWSRDYILSYRGTTELLEESFRRITEIVKRGLLILRVDQREALTA